MAPPKHSKRDPKLSGEGRSVVLVLGDRGLGGMIRERLHALGFETRLEPPLPMHSPTAALRAQLAAFAKKEQGQNSLWLHPGVTPLAERSEWPTLGKELGVQFIGPSARSLSLFNNRLNLLGEAEKSGISDLLLTTDAFHSVREIEKLVRSNRFKLPFVLKSVRGGSGLGVRVIQQPEDLGKSLALWLEQVRRSVGESIILIERYLEGARRIVQPFVRFPDGKIRLFPAVDASLTSRLRKLVEFCPAQEGADSPQDADSELKRVREWTHTLAERTGYIGVGSFEYLVDGARTHLIEGIPRLNTGFPLWEKVAGTSAVAWQLAALSGSGGIDLTLSAPPEERSVGLALRIHAEDPILMLPQPGKVVEVGEKREWKSAGISARLTMSVEAGGEVLPSDPCVIGYLWVEARDWRRALVEARKILDEVWIAGSLQTNERFVRELLGHPWVQEGMFHASFVDEEFIPSVRPEPELLRKIIQLTQLLGDENPGSPLRAKWAVGDQWVRARSAAEKDLKWRVGPRFFDAEGSRALSGSLVSGISGESVPDTRVLCYPAFAGRWQARVGNWCLTLRRVEPSQRASAGPPALKLAALVSGRVHGILFREGSSVPAHETLLLLESLGTLVPHALPVDVRIQRWKVKAEDSVQAGQTLAEFERTDHSG